MTQPVGTLLLVEDNEDDIFFMQRAMRAADIGNALQVARDGQAAIDYLAGAGRYADRERYPLPCLILLDLKLPQRSGFEVLSWLREQADLRTLVVIVLSTSKERRDIQQAYALGANAYMVKPNDVSRLTELLKAIKCFWLTYNEYALPSPSQ